MILFHIPYQNPLYHKFEFEKNCARLEMLVGVGKELKIWDTNGKSLPITINTGVEDIVDFCFHPNQQKIFFCAGDSYIYCYDFQMESTIAGTPMKEIGNGNFEELSGLEIIHINISFDGKSLITGERNGKVRTYDIKGFPDLKVEWEHSGHKQEITSVFFSKEGSGWATDKAGRFSVKKKSPSVPSGYSSRGVGCILGSCYSPKYNVVYLVSNENKAFLYDIEKKVLIKSDKYEGFTLTCCATSEHFKGLLMAGTKENGLIVINTNEKSLPINFRHSCKESITSIDIGPDGSEYAYCADKTNIYTLKSDNFNQRTLIGEGKGINRIKFLPSHITVKPTAQIEQKRSSSVMPNSIKAAKNYLSASKRLAEAPKKERIVSEEVETTVQSGGIRVIGIDRTTGKKSEIPLERLTGFHRTSTGSASSRKGSARSSRVNAQIVRESSDDQQSSRDAPNFQRAKIKIEREETPKSSLKETPKISAKMQKTANDSEDDSSFEFASTPKPNSKPVLLSDQLIAPLSKEPSDIGDLPKPVIASRVPELSDQPKYKFYDDDVSPDKEEDSYLSILRSKQRPPVIDAEKNKKEEPEPVGVQPRGETFAIKAPSIADTPPRIAASPKAQPIERKSPVKEKTPPKEEAKKRPPLKKVIEEDDYSSSYSENEEETGSSSMKRFIEDRFEALSQQLNTIYLDLILRVREIDERVQKIEDVVIVKNK